MNSLYQPPVNPIEQQMAVFQQNPIQFLLRRNINIPQQFQNDPHGAVQYLLNSGQMTQNGFNQLSQYAQSMGYKLT